MIGTTEIIIIVAVILVLFGASAIPKFAKSLGKAKSEFEKGIKDGLKEEDGEAESADKAKEQISKK
jgi:sec-independent protein translocase protein TatA